MKALTGLKISHKISSLMIGLVVGFVMMGVAYYAQIATEIRTEDIQQQRASTQAQLQQLEANFEQRRNLVNRWRTTGDPSVLERREALLENAQVLLSQLAERDPRFVNRPLLNDLTEQHTQLQTQTQERLEQRGLNNTFSPDNRASALPPVDRETFEAYSSWADNNAQQRLDIAAQERTIAQTLFAALLLITAIGTTVAMYFIYRSIVLPLWHIQGVIARQNRGETEARVQLTSQDELGTLGRAFNRLLDERIQVLESQAKENEQLNESIITLIKSLGAIAQKDLTIKVPVSADVTGTVSDAVNLLTSETARTLHQVTQISAQVNRISDQLLEQSGSVSQMAEKEREQVAEANRALESLAKAMNQVAMEARTTNQVARTAIEHTHQAQSSVGETVTGIRAIRSTLGETEKRIKRLGDRSQEITGIVNLINTIAERTHILALNASMHAASAGEAGKGFAVVAEEVQRLAENAREATSDISAMVNNIRVETSDTVNIMNTLITQVAEGTRLAEDSGQRMQNTEKATRQLVDHVKSIATNSVAQASNANRVRDRAQSITESTQSTHRELEQQGIQVNELKACARTLVERVSVFHLPEFQAEAQQAVNSLKRQAVNQDLANQPSQSA
ncbi:methyl-accepting chemotaxis protein [Marinimicrobium locisalis]|uniref:methyl-accepting chemotaxis protein n=1 Tax=Marinimicrobium locisalis TaxID=546022 RepID=UPI0032217D14